ncbi:MAG: VCBS repeat-containing protein, partial [Bacteroidota bacterium]
MNRGYLLLVFWCLLLLVSCEKTKTGLIRHTSEKTGIQFVNKLSPTADLNILNYLYYYNGAGVAAGDYNNDGLIDLYFVGNQEADKLYINSGNFQFEDVTAKAEIHNEGGFSTGVTNVDINADGLIDIYVCKVGSHQTLQDPNKLFINKGIDSDGIPSFEEAAEDYHLDLIS